jgi:hypothetical protein
MPVARRTPVYVEQGPRLSFACAVDWPGWSRSGRGDQDALETLAARTPRYSRVVRRAGLDLPRITVADLDVVETVAGNATTDFGAPNVVAEVDRQPLTAAAARRMAALLVAAWEELDAVVAGAPAALRKGPRGGGRDRDKIVAHVIDAERAYARKIGVRRTAAEWHSGGIASIRHEIREVLSAPTDGGGPIAGGWTPRSFARRTAWHALDHAWEIEDKSE